VGDNTELVRKKKEDWTTCGYGFIQTLFIDKLQQVPMFIGYCTDSWRELLSARIAVLEELATRSSSIRT